MKQYLIEKYTHFVKGYEEILSHTSIHDHNFKLAQGKLDAYREILTDLKMLPDYD